MNSGSSGETVDERLQRLGIALPTAMTVAEGQSLYGRTVPFFVVDKLVFVSGQGPLVDGRVRYRGKFGVQRSVEDGIAAARLCGLLSAIRRARDRRDRRDRRFIASVRRQCGSRRCLRSPMTPHNAYPGGTIR